LNLSLDVVDGIRWLNVEGDGLAGECLYEDLREIARIGYNIMRMRLRNFLSSDPNNPPHHYGIGEASTLTGPKQDLSDTPPHPTEPSNQHDNIPNELTCMVAIG
jgi:hypothetical protein